MSDPQPPIVVDDVESIGWVRNLLERDKRTPEVGDDVNFRGNQWAVVVHKGAGVPAVPYDRCIGTGWGWLYVVVERRTGGGN